MLWYQDWLDLIQKYGRDKHGRTIPMEKLQIEPMHKIWGWYQDALAFYKMKRTYFSLDDVPDRFKDGHKVEIRTEGKLTSYIWRDGEWKDVGSVHDSFYKG